MLQKYIVKGNFFMLKHLFAAALIACFCLAPQMLSAEDIVIRKRSQDNPTITFTGAAGDTEMNNAINRFLSVCGWFDAPRQGNSAEYTLRSERVNGFLHIYLFRADQRIAGWRFTVSGNARQTAKQVVDTVIEHVFEQLRVRGFCQSRIAFCAETAPGIRNIFLCDIDGGNIEQITNYNTLNVEPCWSPTGQTICFSKYGRTGIDVIETTVATPRRSRIISSFRGINTGAAISPDGNYLAVILSPDHQVDLYILGLNQRTRRRLTSGIAVEASPCWSPDGKKLAFVSDRRGNPRIFIVNADGSNLQMLPTVGIDAVTPAWSSDGKIAYATRRSRGSAYSIAVYNLNTGSNEFVSRGEGGWESPGWAADNRQVVCKRILNGKSSLWIVDTLTGRERELLRTGTELFDPAWSPCIRR